MAVNWVGIRLPWRNTVRPWKNTNSRDMTAMPKGSPLTRMTAACQTAAYCTDDERPDTYRRCRDTARTQARSVIACTAQPEPETSPEDDERGQHSRQESDVDDSIVPAEQPPQKGDSVNQWQLHGWNRPDTDIGEGSLDMKDIAQQERRQAHREQVQRYACQELVRMKSHGKQNEDAGHDQRPGYRA